MNSDCYITSVKDFPTASGQDRIEYVYKNNVYGFGNGARGLTNLKEGDKICFYLTSRHSVVLHAIVSRHPQPGNPPENWIINDIDQKNYYDTEVELINVKYVEPEVKISEVREKLGLGKNWGNYVIQTHKIPESDFNVLIGSE